ncbi:Hsp20/alpha crystallin family protein [Nisaea sediminum]|uniref:Hsp20/alpha crystallin family protein n=1 Tax=Nisaea sediminum TaxID=2775867 RepID=UPI0018687698|nr:Hsp20/alpha crystallin family protein [Nisaea sediminum]
MGEVTEKKVTEPARTYADPFTAFRAEMDRMFHNFLQTPTFSLPFAGSGNGMVVPSADMKEADGGYTLTAELPGIAEEDIDLSVANGMITIKGEKSEEKTDEKESYHLTERRYGAFQRSFRLPDNVDEAKIKASFDKGVLTVSMPKSKDGKHQERKIKIGA